MALIIHVLYAVYPGFVYGMDPLFIFLQCFSFIVQHDIDALLFCMELVHCCLALH